MKRGLLPIELRVVIAILAVPFVLLRPADSAARAPARRADDGKNPRAPTIERVVAKGIENLYRLGPRFYSGGQPEGTEGFAVLERLGVRTIISVDGAQPAVEEARRLGMRYVHLPVGDAGVPRDLALRIVKAADSDPGPVFIHCHHGKHRGPTAAALLGIAGEGWSKEQATGWLRRAGTSPDYPGLFATVDRFTVPTAEELGRLKSEEPERARVSAIVEAMVAVDASWEHLKAIRESGLSVPPAHPDIDPPHEAVLLAEGFRELLRTEEARARGEGFLQELETAQRRATTLAKALRADRGAPSPGSRTQVEAAFAAAGGSCTACHSRYRDR